MKLMIIDGNSILNRAFYGIRPLTTREGLHTNAVFGFLNILFRLREEIKPDGICVCFDLKAPTFRHKMYDGYKAGRRPTPPELLMQIPVVKNALDVLGIARLELEGFEADDLLGTLAEKNRDGENIIITGDRDSLQLVSETTVLRLITTKAGQTETQSYDIARLMLDYGLAPQQFIDLKALEGDSSDNIPGVAGVGEKTALELIRSHENLDNLYLNLDDPQIRPTLREKLEKGRESAYLSRDLGRINKFVPVDCEVETLRPRKTSESAQYELYKELEFRTFIDRFGLKPETAAVGAEVVKRGHIIIKTDEQAGELMRLCEKGVTSFAENLRAGAFSVCAGDMVYSAIKKDYGGYDALAAKYFAPEIQKAGYEIKPAILFCMEAGMETGGYVFDGAVAAFLSGRRQDISSLAEAFGASAPASKPEKIGLFDEAEDTGDGLFELAGIVEDMRGPLTAELREAGMDGLFNDIEMPLCEVMAYMQHVGFAVDRERLAAFGEKLTEYADIAGQTVYSLAGVQFNINSPKQLGEILFDRLGLQSGKKTKTGWSTDADVLEKLRDKHEIIPAVLLYRQFTKLKSTYIDGLLRVISSDGRIHSSFNQTGTVTGRISSSEPNMQNIPVRTEIGGELRRMFVATSGYTLVDADYSQIELRVLAHIADDNAMRNAFEEGQDIHRITASQVMGVTPEEVTPLMRSHAKAVNFGIVYGISDFSLADDIKVSRAKAREYIDRYLEKYSGVRDYMERVVEKAKADGYVSTLTGRRRYLPEITSSNFNIRSGAQRIALNTPIQGTAADIIKLAMVNVYRRIKSEKLRSRLILQVHDELIVEAAAEEAGYIMQMLADEMKNAMKLSVSLEIDVGSGDTWLDAKN